MFKKVIGIFYLKFLSKGVIMKKVKRISFLILAVLMFACFCQPVIASSEKVNINTATKEQLMTLKNVGDKIADRIIEYRTAHPFKKIEDLMNVKGIGQKVFDTNKHLLVV